MSRLARVWIRHFPSPCVSEVRTWPDWREKKVGDETEMKCEMPDANKLGRRKDGVLFITRPATKCVQDPFPRAFERPDSFGIDVGS